MFCSVKTDEGDDAGFISLSGHLTHICMFPSGTFPSDPCSTS